MWTLLDPDQPALTAMIAQARAALPDCQTRIDHAVYLLTHGHVEAVHADGAVAVRSQSHPETVYQVNGVCLCPDFDHAPSHLCAHRLVACFARRLQRQQAGPAATPDAPLAVPPVPALPEAPASCNVRVQVAGHEVQWTLHDTDEARLAQRLTALLALEPVATATPTPEEEGGEGWCAVHRVRMKHQQNKRGGWWSHKTPDGQWYKGK